MTRGQRYDGEIYPAPRAEALDDAERPLAGGLLEVPWRVSLEGEWLRYEHGDRDRFDRELGPLPTTRDARTAMRARGLWHYKAPSSAVLRHFIEIADAKSPARAAELVLGFADRYGVLDLCPEHRMPASHNPGPFEFRRRNHAACEPYDHLTTWTGRERIEDWVRFAGLARLIRNVSARLQQGRAGTSEEWDAIRRAAPTMYFDPRFCGRNADEDWFNIRWLLNAWLMIAGSQLQVRGTKGRPALLRFTTTTHWGALFNSLGMQLLLHASGATGLAICSECNEVYELKRRIDPSRDNFCPAHAYVAIRRAKARDRINQGAILRLHRQGRTARQIAGELGATLQRTKRVIARGRVT